jgi:hypothetical protein
MSTISYIKIFGPPVREAIKELEKIAVDMPEASITKTFISNEIPLKTAQDIGLQAMEYINGSSIIVTSEQRKNIISKSGEKLGEYDFFFEWFKEPTMKQLNALIEKIDVSLSPLGCTYTITTKK